MKNWKKAAITSGIGVLVTVVICFVLGWTLPKHETRVQPIKQEIKIHKLQKDFNVEDIRASVKAASEVLRNLEKSNVKEVLPELFILGQQFKRTRESWAGGTETVQKR